ncbi:MAG TPA: M28 family peptidase [bacterium]|nr:M28 family peptidase [bacterium]
MRALVVAAIAVAGLVVGAPGPGWSQSDSVLVVVPLADVLEGSHYDACRGFVLSRDQALVMLAGEDAHALAGTRALEQGLSATRRQGGERLWASSKPIPADVALQAGIRVLATAGATTVFTVPPEAVYRLLEKGYFVSEVDLRPLAELKQPHFGRDLTLRLLEERPMSEARRDFIHSLADSVNADSLRKIIYLLTYDQAAGQYRSRFAARYDLEDYTEPFILNRLSTLCPAPACSLRSDSFYADLTQLPQYKGGDSIWTNLILTKPGAKTRAHYIVCAHYDAIGVRQPGWDWLADPAPGADDNATGVASVLECARLLSGLNLDVGVTFIAFSGEELGLQGSRAYSNALVPADSVLGVIDLDMLGYVSGLKRTVVTYDIQSKWLSDLITETADALEPAIVTISRDETGVARSDQASFWRVHIPGVMLSDPTNEDGDPLYPYYHTLADTLGQLDIDEVRDNAKLVVAYLARFAAVQADTLSDLKLTSGSMEWKWVGRGYAPFVAGDSLTLLLRAVNVGGSMREPRLYDLEIRQGDRAAGAVVYTGTRTVEVAAGGYAEVTASWKTSAEVYGNLAYTCSFRPAAQGVESDTTNNTIQSTLQVMSPSLVLRGLHVFPNPVTDPAGAKLAFEILMPDLDFAGQLDVRVFDLEGRKVGEALLVRSHTRDDDIAMGKNTVALSSILGGAWDLAPGLYFCVADLALVGGNSASATSKFAVAR